MTTKRPQFLVRLLKAIIDEWGIEKVHDVLGSFDQEIRSGGGQNNSPQRPERRSKKSTAIDHMDDWQGPEESRQAVRVLAEKFDRKDFLPRLVDIRQFLAAAGEKPGGIRDRPDGFRRLMSAFLHFPPEKLEDLANSARYSGPARLGPLADAIRSTGEAMRQQKDEEPEK